MLVTASLLIQAKFDTGFDIARDRGNYSHAVYIFFLRLKILKSAKRKKSEIEKKKRLYSERGREPKFNQEMDLENRPLIKN